MGKKFQISLRPDRSSDINEAGRGSDITDKGSDKGLIRDLISLRPGRGLDVIGADSIEAR